MGQRCSKCVSKDSRMSATSVGASQPAVTLHAASNRALELDCKEEQPAVTEHAASNRALDLDCKEEQPAVTEDAASNRALELDNEAEDAPQLKYSGDLETDVTMWIEAVSGEIRGSKSFAAWLKDGQVLCKLANGIKPGTIKKINTQSKPFKERENITYFQQAAREFGVHEHAMFGTTDLYEEKNIGSVVNCIFTVGGAIQTHVPSFTGPKLGFAMVAIDDKKRNIGICTDQFGGLSKTMEVQRLAQRSENLLVVPKKSDDAYARTRSPSPAGGYRPPRSPSPVGAPRSTRPSWGVVYGSDL